ncbi:MAG: TolC family protein [Elusimicrobia bacterium]|nr:TolC family protein [Elusimicrobiota bacterium]
MPNFFLGFGRQPLKILSLVFTLGFLAAPESLLAGPAGLSLVDVISEAVANSPAVARAMQEYALASLEEPGFLALTDPVFSASLSGADDRGPRTAPIIEGEYAKSTSLDLALTRQWLTGGQASFFFNTQKTDSPSYFRTINPTMDSELGFKFNQPLMRYFQGRPDIAKREGARSGVKAAEARLRRAQEEAAVQAAFAYVATIIAREQQKTHRAALEDSKQLRDTYAQKRRYGLSEESDLLQAEASVKTQEAELLLAQWQIDRSENLLRAALYWPHQEPISELYLPKNPERAPPDFKTALSAALNNRGDLVAIRHEVERSGWFERLEKLQTLPELSAFVAYTSGGLNEKIFNAWKESLGLSRRVLSGGFEFQLSLGQKQESLRREQAHRQLEALKADLRRVEASCRQDAADAIEQITIAQQRRKTYEELLTIEERKLAAAQENFNRGRATTDLLIRFQGDIHRTKSNLIQAQADDLIGWAKLGLATGTLLETLQEISQSHD